MPTVRIVGPILVIDLSEYDLSTRGHTVRLDQQELYGQERLLK